MSFTSAAAPGDVFGPDGAELGLFGGAPAGTVMVFSVVTAAVVVGSVIAVVAAVRSVHRLRAAGIHPLAVHPHPRVTSGGSTAQAGPEQRLAALDALYRRGLVGPDEYERARAALRHETP